MTRSLSPMTLALNRIPNIGGNPLMFDPSSVDNLSWWIDPDDDSTVTRLGLTDEIDTIDDKGPNSSSTTLLQRRQAPIDHDGLFAVTAHGRQWMEGNGTDRALVVADETEPAVLVGTGPYTLFLVGKRNFASNTIRKGLIQKGADPFYRTHMFQDLDGAGTISSHVRDGVDAVRLISPTNTVEDQDRFIVRTILDRTADDIELFVNGTSVAGPTSTSAVGDLDETASAEGSELIVGAFPSASDLVDEWNGLIGEILLYKRALTLQEITDIENYLEAKWLA